MRGLRGRTRGEKGVPLPRKRRLIERAAVGYARRSTDKQEQSIPDQQRAIERYCDEQGLKITRWYIDDAISGTKATNRPAFQKMLAAAGSPSRDFGLVVVYDVKRFGRLDNDEAGFYRHTLRQHGVEVLYVAEGFAGLGESSDTDDLLRPVKQWQARQESKDLSKVTIRGQLSKADTGAWMGGVPPHGYDIRYTNDRDEFLFVIRFLPDGCKQQLDSRGGLIRTLTRGEQISISKRDRGSLVFSDPDRVETIREIFRLYTEERRGLRAISDHLNTSNIPTPRGPKWARIYSGQWRDSTIRAILINPLYCGDMVWNRRTDARFHRIERHEHGGIPVERRDVHGHRLVPNDPSDWITIRDTHEPIVSRRVWTKAKEVREGRGKFQTGGKDGEGGWSGKRARFLLSGLVRCGRCGGRYQGVTRTKGKPRADGTKVKTRYYGCGSYIARGRSACEFGAIRQEVLETAVIKAVLEFYEERYGGEGGMDRLAEAVREHLGHEAQDIAEARRRLDADRERVEATIASLLDNLSPATRDMAEKHLADLRKERERLRFVTADLDRLSLRDAEVQDMIQELGAFLAGLEVTLRSDVNDRKVAVLRRCLDAVPVCDEHDHLEVVIRLLPHPGADVHHLPLTV